MWQRSATSIIEVSKFVGGDDADIEDLFDEAFYLQLVQSSYPGTQVAAITARVSASIGGLCGGRRSRDMARVSQHRS